MTLIWSLTMGSGPMENERGREKVASFRRRPECSLFSITPSSHTQLGTDATIWGVRRSIQSGRLS